MINVFFPDEEISTDDLYFVCYMIERVARHLKQPNKYVVNMMGHDELAKKLSLADTLHSENPLAVEADWIDDYQLQSGDYDVTKVDAELCPTIPTATQMGKVYARLINTISEGQDLVQTIQTVYASPICHAIDNYNSSAYYEPSYIQVRAFQNGFF